MTEFTTDTDSNLPVLHVISLDKATKHRSIYKENCQDLFTRTYHFTAKF